VAGDRVLFSERPGLWAFWLYNGGLLLWILLNFFPIVSGGVNPRLNGAS
jgi:nitric oxide reductase subunit B